MQPYKSLSAMMVLPGEPEEQPARLAEGHLAQRMFELKRQSMLVTSTERGTAAGRCAVSTEYTCLTQ